MMSEQMYNDLFALFEKHDNLKAEYPDLFKCVTLVKEQIANQKRMQEIQQELFKMNNPEEAKSEK